MQRLARCASVAALLLAALAGAAAQPSGYAGPATANPSRTSPAANAAPATTRTTTTVNPLFLPRAWSPFKDYKEGEVAVGADGRNYAAKYWNRNTTVTPTPGASQDDIDGWAWKPATEADVQKHIQWWSSWYSSITATPFTKTEADVSTPMIETPQPTPLKNRNKGYGMVPAAGTRVNKGWMCMEWIDDMGYTFPVRIIGAEPGSDSGGNPACLATNYNKTSCNYVSTWFGALGSTPWSVQFGNFERCQQLVDSLNETSPYIMCGSEHNKTFGWPGYDETDPNSWCSAAALALDIRPDLERTHTNSGPMNTTFENAAGRPPNYPTKEDRPNPRPEDELMAECITWGFGCLSCDEIRYACTDGHRKSCEYLHLIPPNCPGDGVRDPAMEWYWQRVGGEFPHRRYTQTTGRTATPVPDPETEKPVFKTDANGDHITEAWGGPGATITGEWQTVSGIPTTTTTRSRVPVRTTASAAASSAAGTSSSVAAASATGTLVTVTPTRPSSAGRAAAAGVLGVAAALAAAAAM